MPPPLPVVASMDEEESQTTTPRVQLPWLENGSEWTPPDFGDLSAYLPLDPEVARFLASTTPGPDQNQLPASTDPDAAQEVPIPNYTVDPIPVRILQVEPSRQVLTTSSQRPAQLAREVLETLPLFSR